VPIQVDITERRSDIADATFRVAAQNGISGVTIRSVAAELGASTTVITNYVPTRADLLINAMERMTDDWLAELETEQSGRSAAEALRAVVLAAVDWDADELVRSQFWVAVLATQPKQVRSQVGEVEDAVREVLSKLVDECGHPNPGTAADELFLFIQGVSVSIVQRPQQWTPSRLRAAANLAVDGVLAT
jgi:AcrR family transcriptional regulator